MKNKIMNQLTLGELIQQLESIHNRRDPEDEPELVYFDFGYQAPGRMISWRGDYSQLAIQSRAISFEDHGENTLPAFLEMLKGSVGQDFEGYKGGTYRMGNDTPLWVVENYSDVGWTGITGAFRSSCGIIIINTAYFDY